MFRKAYKFISHKNFKAAKLKIGKKTGVRKNLIICSLRSTMYLEWNCDYSIQ